MTTICLFQLLTQPPLLAFIQPWMWGFIVVACSILCILIVSPLTAIVHELGHAIPALLLTKKKVNVYIGSHGDPNEGVTLKLSRLTIIFKYNVILWNHGLCHYLDTEVGLIRQFIIILFGPLTSLIFGFSVCYYLFSNFEDGRILFLGSIILASSLLDFFFNILPSDRGTRLHDGTIVYNDGKQLAYLIEFGLLSADYEKAKEFYLQKEYIKASKYYIKLIKNGVSDPMVFNIAISSLVLAKEYELAHKLIADFEQSFTKDSGTYTMMGFLHSKLGENQKSIELYNEAILLDPKNSQAFNNRGFQKNLNKDYESAILDFNKALELGEDGAYPLCNRGRAKIGLGLEEEGLKDILQSIELDKDNSYAYRNLGIYYIRKKERALALENLELALKLDPDTFQIEELLLEARGL